MEDKSYSQMRKDFQNIFFQKIEPILANIEKDYKKERYKNLKYILESSIKGGLILSLLLICVGIVIFLLTEKLDIILIKENLFNILIFLAEIIAACTLINYIFISFVTKKLVESAIKKQCMTHFCEAIGNLEWTPQNSLIDLVTQGYINQDLDSVIENNAKFDVDADKFLVKSNLIPDYDIAIPDDIFNGVYKGVKYNILEAKFCNYNDSEKTEIAKKFAAIGIAFDVKTLFSGIIIKLDMNKNFHGNTLIFPNSIMHNPPSDKLQHTVLEDIKFEKKFDVFTDDKVEARYLITPSFMERLNHIKLAFNADYISCAFYNQYLLIGIKTTKDMFTVGGLTNSLNNKEQFSIMFEETLSIIQLIYYFKLEQKTGL